MENKAKRPDGITAISIFLIVISFFTELLGFLAFLKDDKLTIISVMPIIMGIVMLIMGIGILKRFKWSWWFGVSILEYFIVSSIFGILKGIVSFKFDLIIMAIVSVFVVGALLYYFINKKVVEYFAVSNLKFMRIPIIISIIVCICLILFTK